MADLDPPGVLCERHAVPGDVVVTQSDDRTWTATFERQAAALPGTPWASSTAWALALVRASPMISAPRSPSTRNASSPIPELQPVKT